MPRAISREGYHPYLQLYTSPCTSPHVRLPAHVPFRPAMHPAPVGRVQQTMHPHGKRNRKKGHGAAAPPCLCACKNAILSEHVYPIVWKEGQCQKQEMIFTDYGGAGGRGASWCQ